MSLIVKRVGAYLVDLLILFLVLAPIGYLVQWAVAYQPQTGLQPGLRS